MTLSFISDRTLYSYYFVLSCRHICNILYGFCVGYSVLLSLGRINISCFLFPVSAFSLGRRHLTGLVVRAASVEDI